MKNHLLYLILFLAFLHAILDGSTPRCLIFFFKFLKKDPSLEPISKKNFLFLSLIPLKYF